MSGLLEHPAYLVLLLSLLAPFLLAGRPRSLLLRFLAVVREALRNERPSDGESDLEPLFLLSEDEDQTPARRERREVERVQEPQEEANWTERHWRFFMIAFLTLVAVLILVPFLGVGAMLLVVFYREDASFGWIGAVLVVLMLPIEFFVGRTLLEIIRGRSIQREDAGLKTALLVALVLCSLIFLLVLLNHAGLLPAASELLGGSGPPPAS